MAQGPDPSLGGPSSIPWCCPRVWSWHTYWSQHMLDPSCAQWPVLHKRPAPASLGLHCPWQSLWPAQYLHCTRWSLTGAQSQMRLTSLPYKVPFILILENMDVSKFLPKKRRGPCHTHHTWAGLWAYPKLFGSPGVFSPSEMLQRKKQRKEMENLKEKKIWAESKVFKYINACSFVPDIST